ncbi:hypothetical protein Achl_4197 (plasmid) [Pseudarthrobacter chlorophenolicus A6]|uniref:Uncharacterized protein n=1 Tax=Pseudarthrobacter chlorophenolicus (strain ATCC 700700 / DSM 12829 / CIP 107037 / JCM 12360 / KCTC 9906 / NCIMB 13794 / A6) TaxID=452863 RepID=B8HIA1_PSECP|nr:hypothetical protein [Pseudarthrobacter chlorophenolicus]ACL42148.1 hypothetical protein Achl_4197 [Pseudarthrobacter chlorophenolicus A6]SDQ14065.1 hypothetical protein SAMN04489738_0255 [Pseudarthrobacter chlorophenolicus]
MTTDITRQPKGIPVGGQFAATAHAEPAIELQKPETKTVTERFLDREAVFAKRRRLYEQLERMERIQAAHSLRSVAATILARFPGAVTLRVGADQDGRDEYAPVSIANVDGGLLQLNMPEADYDDEWTFEQMVQDGPDIRELVTDLEFHDDGWTEGVGFIHGTGKRQRKTVDINLQAALNAPDPFIAEEHDPRTRTLSLDEQTDLVEAANHGVVAMEDILDDNNSFDEHRQFEVLENLKARVNTLLTVTTKQD